MTATQSNPSPETRPALLIVDDDALIADTLGFVLGTDFEVYPCESRAQAVDLLRELPQAPQLALVDLGLPPTPHAPDEGFRLIADLLAHSPNMQIFVLSGQNEAAHARHARALGAAEFIAKPCDPALLKHTLLRALELRDAELRRRATQADGPGRQADRTGPRPHAEHRGLRPYLRERVPRGRGQAPEHVLHRRRHRFLQQHPALPSKQPLAAEQRGSH